MRVFQKFFFVINIFSLFFSFSSIVNGATLTVNSKLDDGDGTCTVAKCTFRDAISNSSDGDTITFSSSVTGTINIKDKINIDYDLSIEGPGADILTLDLTSKGSNPASSLIEIGGKFYGTTRWGGLYSKGTIFEWDPGTNSITKQYNFNYDGINPNGSLIEIGGKFYGTTSYGGLNGAGTIFEWDPGTNSITKQYNFSYSGGGGYSPQGSLIKVGDKFYGTTNYGGLNDAGTIFEWDPGTNSITKQYNFSYLGGEGSNPQASLIEIGGKFYGTTYYGGLNGAGIIFEWDPATNSITKQYNFSYLGGEGSNPSSSLTAFNGNFYGTTHLGGLNSYGTIFEWDPATNSITKQYDFDYNNNGDGKYPRSSLIEIGGKFYGTTSQGGDDNSGTIFEWNPATNSITKQYDFNPTNGGGYESYSSLIKFNDNLYGTTYFGGANNDGTFFEWNPVTNTITKQHNLSGNPHIYHTSGVLDISGLTITSGSNAIYQSGGTLNISNMIFDGNHGENEVLYIEEGDGVNISNTKFLNNYSNDYSGAIYAYDTDLTINNSTFSNNSIDNEYGGAIYFEGYDYNLIINNSTFNNNSNVDGGYGGAVYIEYGNAVITNTTFTNNQASYGGAIYNYNGNLEIINSTFYRNMVEEEGVDLYNEYGDITSINSIFASSESDNCSSPITSLGHNIDSSNSCGFEGETDFINTDPLLDPEGLKNNGGPVKTVALMSGSPAIDAGDDDFAPEIDARGVERPQGVRSDIGAYEYYENEFCGDGDGSLNNPFGVCTWTQLDRIRNYLDKHFVLMNDLNRETADYFNYFGEGGSGFLPIGSEENPFVGSLDGDDNIIDGLYINGDDDFNIGLFGYLSKQEGVEGSGVIKNLNLTGVYVEEGYMRVGVLAGKMTEGTLVNNVSVSGYVQGYSAVGGLVGSCAGRILNSYANIEINNSNGNYIGGLVGALIENGEIQNSYSEGSIEGYVEETGGLVGVSTEDTEITSSYSIADVKGGFNVGGLVGTAKGEILNSYATGNVEANSYGAGGLVGYLWGGTIKYSYATGSVTAGVDGIFIDQNSSYAGGLVGIIDLGIVEESYATGNVSGPSLRVGGLVGGSNGLIKNSYAKGNVEGGGRVGGLVGGNAGQIINSYSIGKINTDIDNFGGLVGFNIGSVTSSYWDKETSEIETSAGGTGKTTSEMKTRSTFISWDFDNEPIWDLIASNYPTLHKVSADDPEEEIDLIVYTLAYTSGVGGTLLGSTTQSIVRGADGTAVTAIANPGYRFVRWSDNSTDNPRTDTNVVQSISIQAIFERVLFGGRSFSKGSNLPLTIVATTTPISITNNRFIFTRNLQLGMVGNDVKELQKFLNSRGFILNKTGAGSPGNETIFFGPHTYKALINFQEANFDSVLKPLGLKKGTGRFHNYTRNFVNNLPE